MASDREWYVDLPPVVDFVLMERAVLSNSVKFTTQGRITLSVEQTVETAEKCVFQFVISDTGIGIDPSVLSTLFIPFRLVSFSRVMKDQD